MTDNCKNSGCRSLGEGISFRYIRESKFKTGSIEVNFLMPLQREHVTANAVLASILKRSCEAFPNYTLLRRRLAMLYGAEVDASVSNIGECQSVSLAIVMPEDRFIPSGEKISAGCADLLCDMIFRPARSESGEIFRDEDMAISLRLADERIKSIINNKGEYARHRCTEIMYEGEPYGIESGGYSEDLPSVTREALIAAWRRMISTAAVNIVMVGAADEQAVADKFAREFGSADRAYRELPPLPKAHTVAEQKVVRERMDMQQSKMVIGMSFPVMEPDGDCTAAWLMSLLYGGTATSLLFNNVREKLSLCYYCSASYRRRNGILFVQSGLEESNYEKSLSEIKKQLEVIVNNEFSDEDLEAARLYAISGLSEIGDSMSSIQKWYSSQFLDRRVKTPEEVADELLGVTREDVVKCAASIKIDTVYLLAPLEKTTDNDSDENQEGGVA